jgi:iron(III) transport system ATP-binding protein
VGDRIDVEELTKVYPGGSRGVAGVSLAIDPGTVLVLLGPSGSGKTTLLRCIAGIERITTGRLALAGRMVASADLHVPPEQRNLSMVFQDYALWPHMVARDNVAFALKRHGLDKAASRRLALEMLGRVGLTTLAHRYPSELSGGEQQRVALARALVGDTGLVLFDEPLSNLDADLRERMRLEISSMVRLAGATTVYITHDQAEAFALADCIGVLDRGKLAQYGAPEEIYASPATPFVARFTGLAGEIDVRVVGRERGGLIDVMAVNAATTRPIAARSADTIIGPHGRLMIRPTAVRLTPPGSPDCHLEGKVTDVAFRGRGYEHAIGLDDGSQLSGVFAEDRSRRGDNVGVRFDAAGCHVFSGGPGAPPDGCSGGGSAVHPLIGAVPDLDPIGSR